jgi:hypothetical protein
MMFVINSSSFLNPALSRSSHQSKPPTAIASGVSSSSGSSLTAASPNPSASIQQVLVAIVLSTVMLKTKW